MYSTNVSWWPVWGGDNATGRTRMWQWWHTVDDMFRFLDEVTG